MRNASKQLLEDQATTQERLQKGQADARGRLLQTITVMAVVNVFLALGFAAWMTLGFSRKWNVLMSNTLNLGIGKPLPAAH